MSMIVKNPIIFLPVESTPRELDYKLHLARYFCQADFDVIIGNPPFIRDELKFKNYKGGFLEKGVNPDPQYYQAIKEKQILLYCLSDEGAAYPAFSVTYKPAVDALKTMEHIFLWGNFQKNDLMDRNVDQELNDKYRVIGNPGFEFSLPHYKNYHQQLKPKNLPNEYILVNTNFGAFNGFTIEENLEACSHMSPETRKMLEGCYEKEKYSFDKFYEWLTKIVSHFPNEQFLIRPHPIERKELYQKHFSKFSNVLVSKEGNVNQIISAAKIVLHNDCTSALQSYLMEVPVISLAQSNIDYIHAPWALSFGSLPATIEEAINQVEYALKYKKWDPVLEISIQQKAAETMSKMFNNLGNSSKALSSIMISEMKEKFKNFKPYRVKDSRSLLQKLKLMVRSYLPLHYKVPVASREAMACFSKIDLQKRLDLMKEVDGESFSYQIKKIYPNTFLISKNSESI